MKTFSYYLNVKFLYNQEEEVRIGGFLGRLVGMNVHSGNRNIKALLGGATKQKNNLVTESLNKRSSAGVYSVTQDLFTGTLLDGLTGGFDWNKRPTTNAQLLFDVTNNLCCNIGTDNCIVFSSMESYQEGIKLLPAIYGSMDPS